MGIHAINPTLLANDAIDVHRPEILLYVPKANGKLELVGVEYWKADADQSLATNGDRPSLFGRAFDGPMPGHNPFMPIHYDMHVWVAEKNPGGVFALFNPALSCRGERGVHTFHRARGGLAMARIFASTMALAATIVVLLVFGVASAVGAPQGCPHNYILTEVGTTNESYGAVDQNGDGFVCVYFGKNPLPKQKDEVVDNKLPRPK